MASHPWPDVNVRTRKDPLPGVPTVGVSSKHQRVNLYYCAFGPDGVLKDTRFILVQVECPYVQFVAAARVIRTEKFVVGVKEGERGTDPKSLMERSNGCRELSRCLTVCSRFDASGSAVMR